LGVLIIVMGKPANLKLKFGRSNDLGEGSPRQVPGDRLSRSLLREMLQNGF
jgi:hypothetical protein